jgi:hypothetical protein
LTASSSAATARARAKSVVSSSSRPASARCSRPGGVDPRREPEADRAGVDPAGIHARHLHQRLQARLARGRERAQAGAHQTAVLSHQRHAVGNGRERHQVEIRVRLGRIAPGALEQRPASMCATPAAQSSGHG